MKLGSSSLKKSVYEADDQRWSVLMSRAQQGDEIAYRQLLSELSSVIKRYLISRLGSHDFIEDCVQDILIAIHKGRHTYHPKRPFRPWLFAIVKNKTIDSLRRRKSYEDALQRQGESQSNVMDRESLYTQDLDYPIIQGRLIKALAPPIRQAIILTKFVGYSNAEAANQLRISETAVKVRVHRGMAKLKRLFIMDEL